MGAMRTHQISKSPISWNFHIIITDQLIYTLRDSRTRLKRPSCAQTSTSPNSNSKNKGDPKSHTWAFHHLLSSFAGPIFQLLFSSRKGENCLASRSAFSCVLEASPLPCCENLRGLWVVGARWEKFRWLGWCFLSFSLVSHARKELGHILKLGQYTLIKRCHFTSPSAL